MAKRQRLRERAHQQRLAEARRAFDEHVSRCDEGDQNLFDDVRLADHCLTDCPAQIADHLGRLRDRRGFN
jgi:hypothetical protein